MISKKIVAKFKKQETLENNKKLVSCSSSNASANALTVQLVHIAIVHHTALANHLGIDQPGQNQLAASVHHVEASAPLSALLVPFTKVLTSFRIANGARTLTATQDGARPRLAQASRVSVTVAEGVAVEAEDTVFTWNGFRKSKEG